MRGVGEGDRAVNPLAGLTSGAMDHGHGTGAYGVTTGSYGATGPHFLHIS